jgi:diaminopimelate decarboxylase
MYLHGTGTVNQKGHLQIGGVDTVNLAQEFGTPLYVYDTAQIRSRARAFKQAFADNHISGKIAYASKAFSCIAMVQLIKEEGLHLDVVSGGELYTALTADFPAEKIHFHGNNKSKKEIEMAVRAGIGCFVVDNFYELKLLKEAAHLSDNKIAVLLRITPGVEAHTHRYISTGGEDSKFGFDLESGRAFEAVGQVLREDCFEWLGLHCHIGSQIFDSTAFTVAVNKIFSHLETWIDTVGYEPKVLNLGGGFGIRYVEGDSPKSAEEYVNTIASTVKKEAERVAMPMPEIWIEPGRSLVGNAGTTLYTIGSQKEITGVRHYLAVDGGMNDNLRPALYDARYEGILANRALENADSTFSIAGKCCESGDMLIWDLPLPKANHQDILAVFSTGAYGYSMANNYNRLARPAVVFVEDGEAQLVVRRETYEDIVQFDLPLKNGAVV